MVLREDIFRRCGPLSYCSGGVVCFECGKIAKTFRALHYTKHKKQTTVNQTLIVILKGFLG